jgi:hypothetical protein
MATVTVDNVNMVYDNGFHAIHDLNLDISDGSEIMVHFELDAPTVTRVIPTPSMRPRPTPSAASTPVQQSAPARSSRSPSRSRTSTSSTPIPASQSRKAPDHD